MNSEEIKRLLDKYYEGATSSDEEFLLKKFFSMENVPPDLKSEQEIFRYYLQAADIIPEPSADFEKNIFSAIENEEKDSYRIRRRRLFVTLSGIAATLLILTGSYFYFTNRSESRDTYSDPEVAYAETMKILYQVSARLNKGTKALGHLNELQFETQKTMVTVSRSAAKIENGMKPLDNAFETIRKADSN